MKEKKYSEKNNYWRQLKAIEYMFSFLKNFRDDIFDDDVFDPICNFVSSEDICNKLKQTFSPDCLKKMENAKSTHNRLDYDDHHSEILRCVWCYPRTRKPMLKMLQEIVTAVFARYPIEKHASEIFPTRLQELQQTFRLSDLERDILLVQSLLNDDMLERYSGRNSDSGSDSNIVFLARTLNRDEQEIRNAVSNKSNLRRYECLDSDLDFNSDLTSFLCGLSDEPLISRYFKKSQAEVLPWDFFGELASQHGELLKQIITAGNGTTPVNILLYGAPGTGKSSFARTLAAELGLDCYNITQSDMGGNHPALRNTPEFRFGALHICNMQIDPASSIIIVDEADEMLSSSDDIFSMLGGRSIGDKGLLNDVLDHVTTPTIWIANTPAEALAVSSRRRFDYSIRFQKLSASQRFAIWQNTVKKMKLEKTLKHSDLQLVAARYEVNAGGITNTLKNLQKLDPAPEDAPQILEKLLANHCELMQISTENSKVVPAADYSLEGLSIKGNIPLERIVGAAAKFRSDTGRSPDRPRMNILLSGPPGTGKSEFVKYLGSVLDAKVVVRMGSDLLSKWVGETEQNIKSAFAQAEAENAILFLDEIDGMLQNRARASQNWEVTQVNELLHQMENFNGILIGATNFSNNLDPATLRRFTFKVQFDYLDEQGKKLFFERMFKQKLSDAELVQLAAIPQLTPGDFRTVRQSMYYLEEASSIPALLAALAAESEAKKQKTENIPHSKFGF